MCTKIICKYHYTRGLVPTQYKAQYIHIYICDIAPFPYHYNDVIMSAIASQNHRHLDCLLNRLCRCRWKIASKLRVTGLCEGNPPVTGGFPSQKSSIAENISIWIRDQVCSSFWRNFGHWLQARKAVKIKNTGATRHDNFATIKFLMEIREEIYRN